MKILGIFLLLTMAGCDQRGLKGPDVNLAGTSNKCFDVVFSPTSKSSDGEFLINKCTGETWTLQYSADLLKPGQSIPDRTYSWRKVNAYSIENKYAGF